MCISASECIPIEYIKDQIEEYRKFDHLGMYAEFLDMFIQDYKDNAMANYADRKTEPQLTAKCLNCANGGLYKCSKCDGEMYFKDEPQTCNDCDQQRCETCVTEVGRSK